MLNEIWKLQYNSENDRFGIWDGACWIDDGLSAGSTLEAFVDGRWCGTRIEMDVHDQWYLAGIGIKGYDLNGMKVR